MNQNVKDFELYEKLNRHVYKFIEEIFKKNIEIGFAKFDESLIRNVIERVLILGIQSDLLEA